MISLFPERIPDAGVTRTSLGSSLSKTATIPRPSSSSMGRSFALWTAKSISPLKRACSNSVTNTPFPPNSKRGLSRIRSPSVSFSTSSADRPVPVLSRASAIMFACATAKALLLVPMRMVLLFMLRQHPFYQFFSLFPGKTTLADPFLCHGSEN